jgi:hypothetical protein
MTKGLTIAWVGAASAALVASTLWVCARTGDSSARADDVASDRPGDTAVAQGSSDAPASSGGECMPLPPPDGNVIDVDPSMADQLPQIVASAPSGSTISLQDGTYRMTGSSEAQRRIQIYTPGITLRSASGHAEDVVIDGEYATDEMVFIGASNTTLADFTLTHAVDHLVHAAGGDNGTITGVRLLGMRFVDSGEQFVKVNANATRTAYVDGGELACSAFQLTDAGRPHIQRDPGGCYTGGIDAHGAQGWHVHHNRFEGIYCAGEGLAEHAIHFWNGARDTLVENNVIINCARGIGLGLAQSGETRSYPDDPYPGVGYIGHYGGLVRNNVIFANIDFYDSGISLAQARGARVYHNTVVSDGGQAFFSSIDYRFANTDADIRNNLTRRITQRDGAHAELDANTESTPLTDFQDVTAGDFHLRAGATDAIDTGVVVPDAGLDIDGQPHTRGGAPDRGADER